MKEGIEKLAARQRLGFGLVAMEGVDPRHRGLRRRL